MSVVLQYIGRGFLSLIAAALLGCGDFEEPPKKPEQQPKPAVSQPLEVKVAETKQYSDEELLDLYEKFLANPAENEEILFRSYEEKRRIGRLVRVSLTPDTIGTIIGDYFVKNKLPTAYYDPNLALRYDVAILNDLAVIQNPRVYTTRDGRMAVYVGFGYWAKLSDFDTKPSSRAIGLLKADDYETALGKVRGLIDIINPSITPENLKKLVDVQDVDVRASVHKALRVANGNLETSPLNYSNLKLGEEALSELVKLIKQF